MELERRFYGIGLDFWWNSIAIVWLIYTWFLCLSFTLSLSLSFCLSARPSTSSSWPRPWKQEGYSGHVRPFPSYHYYSTRLCIITDYSPSYSFSSLASFLLYYKAIIMQSILDHSQDEYNFWNNSLIHRTAFFFNALSPRTPNHSTCISYFFEF